MFYKVEYQKRAHQEVEKIFRVLFPEQGLAVREEQIRLCHEMLDTLLGEQIALCDAGVGIGKTYAYLVACVLLRKYSMLTGRGNPLEQRPVVVSTSSIALQKAILSLGIRADDLVMGTVPVQLDLFMNEQRREKQEKLDRAVDEIRRRFGYHSVQRAFMYQDKVLSSLDAQKSHTVHPVGYFNGR